MKFTITAIRKRQCACSYVYKNRNKLQNVFKYKMPDILQTATQFALLIIIQIARHFTLRNFYEHFKVAIYIQKSWHFALRDILYTKKQIHCKKQDNLCYVLYTKIWTLCVTQFFMEFWNWRGGGGHFFIQKKMYFALHIYLQNRM